MSSEVEGLLAERFAEWENPPHLEREVFETDDPARIAQIFQAFCQEHLGAGIGAARFYQSMQACVLGVDLDDGVAVAVKAHPARTGRDLLDTVVSIQAWLGGRGFPCPPVLAGPVPLAAGWCVVEELVEGEPADAHRPKVRRAMAEALARLHALTDELGALPGLPRVYPLRTEPGRLWPRPHHDLFDFAATAGGAEWIDRIALAARDRLQTPVGRTVTGHGDWSAKEMRVADSGIVAVHDWQSLCRDREPVLVGHAAGQFTMTWDLPVRVAPSTDEMRAFVREYEAARGAPFDATEAAALDAALVLGLAYTARCEHAVDAPTEGHAREWLAAHAETVLREGRR